MAEKSFREKWLEAVDKKNSVLCAGLDPAEYGMGRGEKGLPEGVNKRDWALDYIRAVAPYAAALKPNIQYWKSIGDPTALNEIRKVSKDLGLVLIEDSKLADIGSTNDSGLYYGAQRADAITLAPYAGNMAEAKKDADKRGLGLITMCMMSNPEYKIEKMKLVPILGTPGENEYDEEDKVKVYTFEHVPQYVYLANTASKLGIDGIVVGAPSEKNHITDEELGKIRRYSVDEMLVLLPGVGAQGGEAGKIWKYFDKDNVIVNVGRAMMFPQGQHSTPEEQAKIAEQYQITLNELRTAA